MNNQTRVFIVRHGQTDYNAAHKFDGQIDTRLSELGKKQVQELAETLCDIKIDTIVSSPLSRAIDTATAIAKRQFNDLQVVIESAFTEIDCGDCSGMARSDIEMNYKDLVKQWAENSDPRFPRGENIEDVELRAAKKFLDIIERNKGKTVLVAGHGTLNRALIGYLLHIPYGLRFNIVQRNCAINEIVFTDKNKFKIQAINA